MHVRKNRKLLYAYNSDGIMNEEMKQNIHAKVERYTKRATEIKNNTENKTTEKEQSIDNNAIRGCRKGKQINEKFNEHIKTYCAFSIQFYSVVEDAKFPNRSLSMHCEVHLDEDNEKMFNINLLDYLCIF